MQMITRKCAMLIWARRGVGGVSAVLEGDRVSCCKGNNIIRHLLFDHQEGKRAFLEEDADALLFEPGRETGSVK